MEDPIKAGVVEEQADMGFYADREIIYYKRFVRDNALMVDEITAAGFNERQIPAIERIAVQQGWLKPEDVRRPEPVENVVKTDPSPPQRFFTDSKDE